MDDSTPAGGHHSSLYDVLQVRPDADLTVIRAAYRTLARAFHPDVNRDPDAPRRMRELNAAYEVLTDPERRARYDGARARAARAGSRNSTASKRRPGAVHGNPSGIPFLQGVVMMLVIASLGLVLPLLDDAPAGRLAPVAPRRAPSDAATRGGVRPPSAEATITVGGVTVLAAPATAVPGGAPSAATATPHSLETTAPGGVATTTAPPTAVPTPALRTVLDERFADNHRSWPDDPRATAWFADGAYRLLAREPGRFVAIGAPITEPLREVIATARFRKVGGPPGGGYGLIVRDQGLGGRDGIAQGGRYYVLEVGDRGEFGIWRRETDHWVDLIPWTLSEAVRPGNAANELTVRAIGQRLTFLVNGTPVASEADPALPEGGVGIFLGGDFNEAVLDSLVIQVPG